MVILPNLVNVKGILYEFLTFFSPNKKREITTKKTQYIKICKGTYFKKNL